MERFEKVCLYIKPDVVMAVGDGNESGRILNILKGLLQSVNDTG